jgi:ABC-type multidrug transport system fused ATPase/permease subunit
MLFFAVLGAIVQGAGMPLFSLIFGNLIDAIGGGMTIYGTEPGIPYYVPPVGATNSTNSTNPSLTLPSMINSTNTSAGNSTSNSTAPAFKFTVNSSAFLDAIVSNVYWFLVLGAGMFVASYLSQAFLTITSERQMQRVRKAYFTSLLRQEVSWFDTVGSGTLTTRITADTMEMQSGMGEQLGLFLRFTSQFLCGFILGFVQGWELTLLLIGVTPLLAVGGATMMIALASASKQGLSAYAAAGGIATEHFAAMKTVAAFGGEPLAIKKFGEKITDALKIGIRGGFIQGGGIGLTMFVFYCTYSLALWVGGQLIIAGRYSPGNVLSTFFAVVMGAFALGQAGLAGDQQGTRSRVQDHEHDRPALADRRVGSQGPEARDRVGQHRAAQRRLQLPVATESAGAEGDEPQRQERPDRCACRALWLRQVVGHGAAAAVLRPQRRRRHV